MTEDPNAEAERDIPLASEMIRLFDIHSSDQDTYRDLTFKAYAIFFAGLFSIYMSISFITFKPYLGILLFGFLLSMFFAAAAMRLQTIRKADAVDFLDQLWTDRESIESTTSNIINWYKVQIKGNRRLSQYLCPKIERSIRVLTSTLVGFVVILIAGDYVRSIV